MTNTELKLQIDTDITGKTASNSITPNSVGENLKDIVDYIDQQDAIAVLDTTAVHKTGNEIVSGTKTFTDTSAIRSRIVGSNNLGGGISTGTATISIAGTASSAAIAATSDNGGTAFYGESYGTNATTYRAELLGASSSGFYSNSQNAGHNYISNSSGTGLNYVGRNAGVNTFTVDKLGNVAATKFATTGGNNTQVVLGDGTLGTYSTGTVTANNGLTKTGSNIQLGGNLTSNVDIEGNFDFTMGSSTTPLSYFEVAAGDSSYSNFGDIKLTSSNFNIRMLKPSGTMAQVFGGNYSAQGDGLYLQGGANGSNGFTSFKLGDNTTNSTWFRDLRTSTNQCGMEYYADYSANYTNRSLVDKGYVTSVMPTSGTWTVTPTSITNITSLTFYTNTYTKVGNIVSGQIPFTFNTSAASSNSFIFNLPITTATGVTNRPMGSGSVVNGTAEYGSVIGTLLNSTTGTVNFKTTAVGLFSGVLTFQYSLT